MNAEFGQLYKKHYDRLFTLAYRMTGKKEDAEDIMQISFLNAYKSFEKFRHESSAYTWLYRIVMNTGKQFYNENRKLPALVYSEEHGISQQEFYNYVNSFGKTEDQALASLTRESCLQMFMNCMPSKYRAVLTLRIMLNLSIEETSEILGISKSAVKVNLHRARKLAQSHLEGRCSLVHTGAMCDCRYYTGYLARTAKTDILNQIKLIQNKESLAVEEYTREMKVIGDWEKLYRNRLEPPDYEEFMKKIRELHSGGMLKVLGGS